MTCKDCIHYEECDKYGIEPFDNNDNEKDCCVLYKDKSKFVELPCKINDCFYGNGTIAILLEKGLKTNDFNYR